MSHEMPNSNTSQNCRWHIFANSDELEQATVRKILLYSQQAITARGAFHIVLAGGNTPRKVYASLREIPTNWAAWHIYYGDERCLPSDHEERNSHMAESVWLNHVPIPKTQIHTIAAETGAALAAQSYAGVLNNVAEFDLVLLGLGEDGHTASLFPGHEMGNTSDALDVLVVTDAPKPPPLRISLSARRLGATHQLIFLVSGNSKKQAVQNWRSGIPIPASFITPKNGADIFIEDNLITNN